MTCRELRVPAGAEGERLDHFLASELGSRASAQRAIAAGRVTVDGAVRPNRHRLRAGQVVALDVPEESIAPAPPPGCAPPGLPGPRILFEDAHLLVVDKPAGMVVHPARGHSTGTLAQALAARAAGGADPSRAGIVHRLDRETSGLLVVARDEEVHRRLARDLSGRRLTREYVALLDGRPAAHSATIEAPLGRDRRDRTRMSSDTDRPRFARTHFVVEEALASATLVRVTLETGRTHQIRAHMRAIGHPVSGDPQYGQAGRFGLERQFLHAARLAFEHPVTGAAVDVRSALPDDLEAALARARRERAGDAGP